MKNNIIIALDQGSSSTRATAISYGNGSSVIARAGVPVSFITGQNTCEYEGKALLKSQYDVLWNIEAALTGREISAIAISCQRSTIVLWDKTTGDPLCPVLSWLDGRATAEITQNPLNQAEIHQRTGLYKTPFFSAPKIQWCLKNYPQVDAALKAGKLLCGPVSTFLIWNLTGGKVFAADPTTAQRTLLFNINTMDWDDDILSSFNIPKNILPEIRPSFGDFGTYKNIPIKVCVGDQQAASFIGGTREKGGACINYGTGAFLLLNIGQKNAGIDAILTSLSWNSATKKADYLLEGPLNTAGSLFTWLNALGIKFDISDLDALCATAKAPVWFFPALGGLGAPYWDFAAEPVIAGLKPTTSKEDIVCGALRGLALLMADIAFYIKKNGFEINSIQSSGGLSRSVFLSQFQSDILGMTLTQNKETETTLLGASSIAALGMGFDIKDNYDEKNYTIFKPVMAQPDSAALYNKWRLFFDWAKQGRF